MLHQPSIAGLVLAAGFSSRMGAFKPLLPLGSTTLIERVIRTLQQAGVSSIYTVVGYQAHLLRPLLKKRNVIILENRQYPSGMFSSVITGIHALPATCHNFFLWPVDIPLVQPTTLRTLIDTQSTQRTGILYPLYAGKRGHPPLIASRYIPQMLDWNGAGGMRAFLRQFADEALDVPVEDPGILLDVDTPSDYLQVLNYGAPSIHMI